MNPGVPSDTGSPRTGLRPWGEGCPKAAHFVAGVETRGPLRQVFVAGVKKRHPKARFSLHSPKIIRKHDDIRPR